MDNNPKILAMFLAASILIVGLSLTGCVEEENKIIIGTSADFPPFEYIDTDGTIIGFDIEMVTMILEDAGYKVEVKDIAFDSLIASLENDKIDVIAAAMTITAERDEQIDFSDPYYEADQSVLAKKGAELNLSTNIDLQNYIVGAQTGTTGAAWVKNNLIDNGTMNEDDFKRYETYTLAVLDLVNGNIEALVLDKPVAESFVKSRDVELVMTIITGESYGLGVKEGNSDLLEEINSGLDSLIGSTQWDTLIMKYFE
jgi:polar amino acid transport system substrate-binding protein